MSRIYLGIKVRIGVSYPFQDTFNDIPDDKTHFCEIGSVEEYQHGDRPEYFEKNDAVQMEALMFTDRNIPVPPHQFLFISTPRNWT